MLKICKKGLSKCLEAKHNLAISRSLSKAKIAPDH
jgi:hypothetical protein